MLKVFKNFTLKESMLALLSVLLIIFKFGLI